MAFIDGVDLSTFAVTTTTGTGAGAQNVRDIVRSITTNPSDETHQSGALKRTQVINRAVRTDDSLDFELEVDDDFTAQIANLIENRNKDITLTSATYTGGFAYTARPGTLRYRGLDISDGVQVQRFSIDNIIL